MKDASLIFDRRVDGRTLETTCVTPPGIVFLLYISALCTAIYTACVIRTIFGPTGTQNSDSLLRNDLLCIE